ncbi:hypothetical protein BHE74_00014998 [Ensete ventricosum]|nr:hypothetical protein GW17_00052630 [Ensete ventricosum]RWW76879.1 hypothetical protein BHE74_00014998 [Ensete ventricosum]RZS21715.1 hypothetical protein BHM03_00054384 [Ensete ventricosum]
MDRARELGNSNVWGTGFSLFFFFRFFFLPQLTADVRNRLSASFSFNRPSTVDFRYRSVVGALASRWLLKLWSKDHIKVQGDILEGLVARVVSCDSSKHMEKVLKDFPPPALDGGLQFRWLLPADRNADCPLPGGNADWGCFRPVTTRNRWYQPREKEEERENKREPGVRRCSPDLDPSLVRDFFSPRGEKERGDVTPFP